MAFLRALLALPPAASTVADGIDLLHFFVITVTMLGSTGVFVAAAWFCVRYRRKVVGQLTQALRISFGTEVFVISGMLGLFLLWWVIGYRQYITIETAPKDSTAVYVTAKQWMWKFEYPDGTSSMDSLVVPAGKPVKVLMTSRDVIHSFYVPAFRVKQDVVPGRYTSIWFEAKAPGRYPIWCAEYCGTSHSEMRGEVVALSEADYAAWANGRASHGVVSMAQTGAEIAAKRGCFACHTLNGEKHVGPTWSRLYGSMVDLEGGGRVLADEAYLTRSMMDPQAEVVAGYRNVVMPTYRGVLSPAETGAVVELIKSLREGEVPTGVQLPAIKVTTVDGGTP